MFESLLGLVGSLVDALSKIEIKKSQKRRLGKELAKLYIGLSEINENGEQILKLLRKAKKGIQVNIPSLITLLSAQAERIRGIRTVLKKSHIKTVLKIHLPKLKDLQILLEMKGTRIAILTEQLKAQKLTKFRPVTFFNSLSRYRLWWSELKLIAPTEEPLKKSKVDLNELKKLTNLFRQFLVEKFEINEIL